MGLLGAHVSISGGIEKSIRRGLDIGCESIQIFSKNQRQWAVPPLPKKTIDSFLQERRRSSIRQVVIHDSYLINLANPDPAVLKKSREVFIDEMQRADQLEIPYLVFHPGAYLDSSVGEGVRNIADSLNFALDKKPGGQVELLMETTSGQGSHLGYRFEQLADILYKIEKKQRVGICFDTAHAFTAGYDLRNETSYKKTFNAFNKCIGLDKLKVFHLNDSKKDLGTHLDRHENIGKGYLGLEPFKLLVNDPRFRQHPMILETPGGDIYFRENLILLRSLIQK